MREIKSEDQSVVLRRRLFRRDEDGANGASDRNRTCNPLITNQLRYRCATLAFVRQLLWHKACVLSCEILAGVARGFRS